MAEGGAEVGCAHCCHQSCNSPPPCLFLPLLTGSGTGIVHEEGGELQWQLAPDTPPLLGNILFPLSQHLCVSGTIDNLSQMKSYSTTAISLARDPSTHTMEKIIADLQRGQNVGVFLSPMVTLLVLLLILLSDSLHPTSLFSVNPLHTIGKSSPRCPYQETQEIPPNKNLIKTQLGLLKNKTQPPQPIKIQEMPS